MFGGRYTLLTDRQHTLGKCMFLMCRCCLSPPPPHLKRKQTTHTLQPLQSYNLLILNSTSGQPMLCTECLRGQKDLGGGGVLTAVIAVQLHLDCNDCSWTPLPKIKSCQIERCHLLAEELWVSESVISKVSLVRVSCLKLCVDNT